jgi:hypothetical protein
MDNPERHQSATGRWSHSVRIIVSIMSGLFAEFCIVARTSRINLFVAK